MNLSIVKRSLTGPLIGCAGVHYSPDTIKTEIRQQILDMLLVAQAQFSDEAVQTIRERLAAIQLFCQSVGKTFIVVEEAIACNQFDLGGHSWHTATLFRGPKPDASVAICMTQNGSLLYRNSSPWSIYRDAGDIDPNQAMQPYSDLQHTPPSHKMRSHP